MVPQHALCAEVEEMTGAWSLILAVTLPGLTLLVTVVAISGETPGTVVTLVVVEDAAVVEGAVVVEGAEDVVVVGDVVDVVVDNHLFRISQICRKYLTIEWYELNIRAAKYIKRNFPLNRKDPNI